MDWQDKAIALNDLNPISLTLNAHCQWVVGHRDLVEIGGDGFLTGGTHGRGQTPQEAIADHWKRVVEDLPSDRHLVISRAGQRHRFQWSQFMWQRVEIDTPLERIAEPPPL